MLTYNDILVPDRINTNKIISAFENSIDYSKIDEYTQTMQELMLSHEFPAISGYPHKLTNEDIGITFLNGEQVESKNIGNLVWFVTDGHHRAISAINANIPYLFTELDFSTITTEKDMENFRNQNK